MLKYRKVLFLEGNRNGYAIDQCGKTMTVGELREFLDCMDEDREIFLRNDGGYTYGSINMRDFEEDRIMEETDMDDIEYSEIQGHSDLIRMTVEQACALHGVTPGGLQDYYGVRAENIEFVFRGVDEEIVGVQRKDGTFCVNNGVVRLEVDYEEMLGLLEMTEGEFNRNLDK